LKVESPEICRTFHDPQPSGYTAPDRAPVYTELEANAQIHWIYQLRSKDIVPAWRDNRVCVKEQEEITICDAGALVERRTTSA
jgi:hypothetical protein